MREPRLFSYFFALLSISALSFTVASAQSLDLYSFGDGVTIVDPWSSTGFRACNISQGIYTPNITPVTNATYSIGFTHPEDPATSSALLFFQSTYEVPPVNGGYELRGSLGCLPPGTNPTVNTGERQYTFSGLLSNCRYEVLFNTQASVNEVTGQPILPCSAVAAVVIPRDATLTQAKCNGAGAYFDDQRKSCMYSLATSDSPSVCGEPSTGLRLDSSVTPGNICYPCSRFGLSFAPGTGCVSSTPTPTPTGTPTGTPTLTPTSGGSGTAVPTPQPTSNPTAVPTIPPVSCGSGCTSYSGLPAGGAVPADGARILDSDQMGSSITCGSIIETENQILEEIIPLTGTGIALHYSAARQPGYVASRSVRIPITSASPPSGLQSVRLKLQIGNLSQDIPLSNTPNQVYNFSDWS